MVPPLPLSREGGSATIGGNCRCLARLADLAREIDRAD
jgi:hypothetical protein